MLSLVRRSVDGLPAQVLRYTRRGMASQKHQRDPVVVAVDENGKTSAIFDPKEHGEHKVRG